MIQTSKTLWSAKKGRDEISILFLRYNSEEKHRADEINSCPLCKTIPEEFGFLMVYTLNLISFQ